MALIAAAIVEQDAYLLYAASVVPLLLVPVFPDIRSNQWLKPARLGDRLHVFQIENESGFPDKKLVIIQFKPGTIRWDSRVLYVPIDKLPTENAELAKTEGKAVPVMNYDLVPHKRKRQWIGIRASQLTERAAGLAYSLEEVDRLILQWEDLQAYLTDIPRKEAPPASDPNVPA